MLQERYGIQFDYDQRNGTYLVVLLDPEQSKQLIPHQLQMLLNNHIPQLVRLELDHQNDTYQLQYDLTAKKRLFQVLQTCPPSIIMFYEIAFRLVQTITNSRLYMLNYSQYILHGDFIYCGRDAADLYIVYLPIPSTYLVSIEQQLRLLLLRMLSTVDGVDGQYDDHEGIYRLMNILQAESYDLDELENVLKHEWMKQASNHKKPNEQKEGLMVNQQNESSFMHSVWQKIKNKRYTLINKKPLSAKNNANSFEELAVDKRITGVTTVLVNKEDLVQEELKVIVNKHGTEEKVHFLEERFIIGRNQAGVHYIDSTEGISRVHCELIKLKDRIEVKDLGSLNGSYLNGEFLVPYKSYPFRFGDVLKIINTEYRLSTL
jgi:hypothetical protein